ncbi:MAG TPA: hypothetical protein VKE24_05695 [Candidatus Acidoferrales bacterium]|nr:hypothetical protein [Candidatus Acidoferrales bacterium]
MLQSIGHRGHTHLLLLLANNEQVDATPEQKADLRWMVTEIKKL